MSEGDDMSDDPEATANEVEVVEEPEWTELKDGRALLRVGGKRYLLRRPTMRQLIRFEETADDVDRLARERLAPLQARIGELTDQGDEADPDDVRKVTDEVRGANREAIVGRLGWWTSVVLPALAVPRFEQIDPLDLPMWLGDAGFVRHAATRWASVPPLPGSA